MLAEFLTELKLTDEKDKINQIVTGSNGSVKLSAYDEYISAISASKGKVPSKGKGNCLAKEEMEKESQTGVYLAMNIGRLSSWSSLSEKSSKETARKMCDLRIDPSLHLSMYSPCQAEGKEY